jgi:DTW domain-containing protein YfiP
MRGLCLKCFRAEMACWCVALKPQAARTRITLLQHPREARNPVGTARMVHLGLPGSRLVEGVDFSHEPALAPPAVVLFPTPGARDIRELRDTDAQVIVIDGTWSQARKIWKENPRLRALPAYGLTPTRPGNYRIRKEPAPHCLATVEAVAELLAVLEDRDPALLLAPFEHMVEQQLGFVATPNQRHSHPRAVRRLRLPFATERVVLAHADARPGEAPRIFAERVASGERWIGSVSALQDFTGGDALVCWGQFVSELRRRDALAPLPLYDLKPLMRDFLKQRLGHVETAAARLRIDSQPSGERGAQRLAHLRTLFDEATRLASRV